MMKPRNALLLLLAAFIWGTSFVSQRLGMDYVEPFTFNGLRSLIGSAVLALFLCLRNRGRRPDQRAARHRTKDLWIGGFLCGLILFAATSLQQIGIQYTTVGKSGFITAFYIVMVPVLGMLLGRKTGAKVWIAVGLALVGLYFLCITGTFTVGVGDGLTFLCALAFAVHILVIDHFSPRVDGVALSCIQFLVCGVVSLPFMFLAETPSMTEILSCAGPLLYAGVLSCGVAYTLQIVGQKGVDPAIASLLLSLESCFSVLSGWVVLGQGLSAREALGCGLMFAAIILAQLPDFKKTKYKGETTCDL